MRTIKLKLLDRQDLVTIVTDAITLGDFKNLESVQELAINWENTKLIDRATQASLELETTVLPSTDALFFVVPTKTKAGLSYKELKQNIKEYKEKGGVVPFNYTNASTVQLQEFWDSIQEEDDLDENESEEEYVPTTSTTHIFNETSTEAADLLEETKSLMSKALENLSKLVQLPGASELNVDEIVEDYKKTLAIYVTKSELNLEAEHLRAIFG